MRAARGHNPVLPVVYAGNPAKFITQTNLYIESERNKMTADNCFGRDFSEAEGVTSENKELLKQMAEKYGVSEMTLYRIKSGENWARI